MEFFGDEVERITELDSLTGELLAERAEVNVFPASHFVTPADKLQAAIGTIEAELRNGSPGWRSRGGRSRQRASASERPSTWR